MPDTGLFAGSPKGFFVKIASSRQPHLSYCEEFLWWSARLAGDTTFNVRVVLRLRGALNLPALEASIVEIARRHETLRTAFPMEAGTVQRRLLPPEVARPKVTDLEPIEADAREAEAARLVLEEANQTFSLVRGPLFRSRVLRLGPESHLLQLTIHHLVIDGGSVDILLRELGVLYAAYSRDEPSPLPEPAMQYAEYAARGKQRLDGERLERTLAYWKAQLAGIPSLLELPRDGPRRATRYYPGHTITFSIDADRTAAIARLARQHRTTTFAFLLGMLQFLLARLSGNPRVAIEVPLDNRRSVDAEGLVGLLVDLVPLCSDLTGDLTLGGLLAAVRRATFGALDHAGVPIHVFVKALDVNVDASHSAVCQVMFNLIDRRERAAYLESLQAELLPLPESPHSKFDMMLTGHLTDVLTFQLLYRRQLFSEARMRELVGQFTFLIDQALADPDGRIEAYSLVTPRAAETLARPISSRPFGIAPGTRIGVLPGTIGTAAVQAALAAFPPDAALSFAPDTMTSSEVEAWLGGMTMAVGDVSAWRRLKKSGQLPSLRRAFFAGGVLVREDVERVRALAPGVDCTYLFSCDDGPGCLSCYEIPADARDIGTIVPVGRGLGDTELVVLTRDRRLAGIGELGELCFRHGCDEIATGLLGRFLPDGTVDRLGGSAQWCTIDGYTIRVDEIASAIMRHPDVLDATVVRETHGEDTALVAHVVSERTEWPAGALEELVSEHLPGYMVPTRWVYGTHAFAFSCPHKVEVEVH